MGVSPMGPTGILPVAVSGETPVDWEWLARCKAVVTSQQGRDARATEMR